MFPQVSGIPGEIKIGAEKEAAITECDIPHVRGTQDPLPGNGLPRRDQWLDRAIRVESPNLRQFGWIDAFMLLRPVSIIQSKDQRPNHAQRSENIEDRAPSERQHDATGNQGSHGYCKPAKEMRCSLDSPALRPREPKLHAATGDGKRAGLAQSQQ